MPKNKGKFLKVFLFKFSLISVAETFLNLRVNVKFNFSSQSQTCFSFARYNKVWGYFSTKTSSLIDIWQVWGWKLDYIFFLSTQSQTYFSGFKKKKLFLCDSGSFSVANSSTSIIFIMNSLRCILLVLKARDKWK